MNEVQNIRKEFEDVIHQFFSNEQREKLLKFLDYLDELGFFAAPASTKWHNAFDGGLAQHSLNVAKVAIKLYSILKPDIPIQKVVFVGLFHDVGKVGLYNRPTYVKTEEGYKKGCRINHASLSLYHLSKFFDLDEDEIHAILYHNGLYDGLGDELKNNEKPLTLILHWADMWVSRFVDERRDEE